MTQNPANKISELPTDLDMGDDRLLPSLLIRGMDSGLKFKDELYVAEAAERRHRQELVLAVERVEVLRARYRDNEAFVRDVWETLKVGQLARPHPPAPCPCGATDGEEHDHRDAEPVE